MQSPMAYILKHNVNQVTVMDGSKMLAENHVSMTRKHQMIGKQYVFVKQPHGTSFRPFHHALKRYLRRNSRNTVSTLFC